MRIQKHDFDIRKGASAGIWHLEYNGKQIHTGETRRECLEVRDTLVRKVRL